MLYIYIYTYIYIYVDIQIYIYIYVDIHIYIYIDEHCDYSLHDSMTWASLIPWHLQQKRPPHPPRTQDSAPTASWARQSCACPWLLIIILRYI